MGGASVGGSSSALPLGMGRPSAGCAAATAAGGAAGATAGQAPVMPKTKANADNTDDSEDDKLSVAEEVSDGSGVWEEESVEVSQESA